MLVLTRKTQQIIRIGPHVTVTIVQADGGRCRVGIDAPKDDDHIITRGELPDPYRQRAETDAA